MLEEFVGMSDFKHVVTCDLVRFFSSSLNKSSLSSRP